MPIGPMKVAPGISSRSQESIVFGGNFNLSYTFSVPEFFTGYSKSRLDHRFLPGLCRRLVLLGNIRDIPLIHSLLGGCFIFMAECCRLFSLCLGCFDRELPFFLSTTSIWVVARSHTLDNVSAGFLINESLNGLVAIPFTKATTTISSSWVWSLTETT